MSENVTEVIAGGAVLAAAVGFLLFAAQGTGLAASRGTYDLTASFQSAEGITVGTDVRLAGVKVGTISRLELNPQTFYADATLTLQDKVMLPDDWRLLCPPKACWAATTSSCDPADRPRICRPGPRSRIPKVRSA